MFAFGNIFNFIGFMFAAQSLLVGLGSIQFVSNLLFAHFVNKESITKVFFPHLSLLPSPFSPPFSPLPSPLFLLSSPFSPPFSPLPSLLFLLLSPFSFPFPLPLYSPLLFILFILILFSN